MKQNISCVCPYRRFSIKYGVINAVRFRNIFNYFLKVKLETLISLVYFVRYSNSFS